MSSEEFVYLKITWPGGLGVMKVAFGWGSLVCDSNRNSSVPHGKFLE